VIELSHGAFLYLAIDILRIRLIPRRAQVDFERDLGAHRVFESPIHEEIVVHSSTSDTVVRRADDMAPAGAFAFSRGYA
jgi:hypothetical protein